MIGIDTHVLVRYLTQDDAKQAMVVNRAIASAVEAGESCYLSTPVMCELVVVLRLAYRQPRHEIVRALRAILETEQFAFDNKDLLLQAASEYAEGSGEFADYVIGRLARSAGCSRTLTLDQGLSESGMFSVLE